MLSLVLFSLFLTLTNAIVFPKRPNPNDPAPFHKPSRRLVPHTYIVHFYSHHTLSKHIAHCGVNFKKTIQELNHISEIHRQVPCRAFSDSNLADA